MNAESIPIRIVPELERRLGIRSEHRRSNAKADEDAERVERDEIARSELEEIEARVRALRDLFSTSAGEKNDRNG
jgi:hypothetical protein